MLLIFGYYVPIDDCYHFEYMTAMSAWSFKLINAPHVPCQGTFEYPHLRSEERVPLGTSMPACTLTRRATVRKKEAKPQTADFYRKAMAGAGFQLDKFELASLPSRAVTTVSS